MSKEEKRAIKVAASVTLTASLLRRKMQREARKTDPELAEILKGSRWLLLKNRDDLKPRDVKKLRLILDACPEIRQ